MADYEKLLKVAIGEEPADLVIRHAQLLNVVTRDVYPATVGVCQDTIAYVTGPEDKRCEGQQEIDARGMWIAPGLIDSHMHIESTHATPEHFANAVLPLGVTTVAQDPHEMANVLGVQGVEYMLQASRGLPLRVLTFVSTCVPSVPGLETSGAEFGPEQVDGLLREPGVIWLAEVMDYWGVIRRTPRMNAIVQAGRRRGTILTGHIRGLGGRELNTYLAAGIDSDHEWLEPGGILSRSRLGMTVEICCCKGRDNIAQAVESWQQRGHLENVVFVTDDIPPQELVQEGHLDRGVRKAIELGMSPVDAVRAATLIPARRLRRPDLGQVSPGRVADLLLVDDLQTFHVHLTVAAGEVVARAGAMLQPATTQCPPPPSTLHSIHLEPAQECDFAIRGPGQVVQARIITQRGRGLEQRALPVRSGEVSWRDEPDLALAAVWHRHGHNRNRFAALLAGSGLQAGALATTYAHDSHNLVVLGRNPGDMATAANDLVESGGGYVAVRDGQVIARAALPVAGILADRPVEELGRQFQLFSEAAGVLGISDNPIGLLTSLPLPVVPSYRPTDIGLVDTAKQEIISAYEFEV